MNPAGGPGKVDTPTTAGTLVQAIAAASKRSGGGVGVLISAGTPGLIGIDIDGVIHGSDVHPFGVEVLERFGASYVEISPSGTGLRGFCLGELPRGCPAGSTAMGVVHHGKQLKTELYAAGGPGRFLRTTGATFDCTAGEVRAAQPGIDWLAAKMILARSNAGGGSDVPDNDKRPVGEKAKASIAPMSLATVFKEIAALRPSLGANEVIRAIGEAAAIKARSKLAAAWMGNTKPFNGDHSTADAFMCCESIRRGASSKSDVVEVWTESGLSHREKFKRGDYQDNTVDKAARSVLADLLKQEQTADRSVNESPVLPEGLVATLRANGDKLTRTARGRLEVSAGNVVVLFRNDPRLRGLLAFNELAQRAERLRSWTVFDRGGNEKAGELVDDDVTRVSIWLAVEFSMRMDHKELLRGIEAAALDARFDPLAERLKELEAAWDGVERVKSWLTDYGKVDSSDCAEYVEAVGRCFLIGAVARALNPGCQMDTVLAIEGAGGAGKSSLFNVLADSVCKGLFADGVHDVSNPVALVEGTAGRWIIELAELAGIRRAQDVEALKASITRRVDSHRRPYDVLPRTIPRRFVFVATTNRAEYLADPSGALLRRFWPVKTTATESNPIDRVALAAIAGQLWGEAVKLYQCGAQWHLSEADGAAYRQWGSLRELRREDGAFYDELVPYLRDWAGNEQTSGRSMRDIAMAVGDLRTVEGDQGSRNRLADTLRSMGMESRKVGGGLKKWFFTLDGAKRFLILREQVHRVETTLQSNAAKK